MSVYTTGSWQPNAGREEAFVEAWSQFAAWASSMPGAGSLRLVRDKDQPEQFTSFGEWETVDAVRAWKSSPEFRERMAQVLQHVEHFRPSELELVVEAAGGSVEVEGAAAVVHYKHEGIATFPVPAETIFAYMSAGDHPPAAFKRPRLVATDGNVVTIDSEVFNPDGSTFEMRLEHTLDRPTGIETRMIGGHFDGARFTHSYTPVDGGTKIDLEGDFPALPGMTEDEELGMIDGFLTGAFAEDSATLLTWSPNGHA
jgi:heme-degrading monooxygenase HmoA